MGQTLGTKLNRIDSAIQTMKSNLKLELNAPIEEAAAATNLRNLINVYVQTEEPEDKNGIWVKAEQAVDQIIIDEGLSIMNQYYNYTNLPAMPCTVSVATCASIDNIVYVFGPGSKTATYKDRILKIDIKANSITEIRDCGMILSQKVACAVGTDVYLIGGAENPTQLYKYDTINNTFTTLASCPYPTYLSSPGGMFLYNNSLYLTKVYDSSQTKSKDIWKYDIAEDTWTYMNTYPYYNHSCGSSLWGKYILFPLSDSNSNNNYSYRYVSYYDIEQNVFGWLYKPDGRTRIEVSTAYSGATSSSSTVRGYVIGNIWYGVSTRGNTIALDLINGTTKEIPRTNASSANTSYGCYIPTYDKLLNVGGTKLNAICMESSTYEPNSLIITQGKNNPSAVVTQLFTLDKAYCGALNYPFYNAVLVDAEGQIDSGKPVFYGDGEKWIQLK